MNPKHFIGAPCTKDPSHGGLRYISNDKCVACRGVHNALPETKAKKAANATLPEAKAKDAAQRATPEAKAKKAARNALPENMAKRAAYKVTPEAKAKRAARRKANPHKRAAQNAKRRAAQLQRTPPWADLEKIAAIYSLANLLGEHVDHVIPLQGAYVSGLHVVENLQCLPASENSRKSNKFTLF